MTRLTGEALREQRRNQQIEKVRAKSEALFEQAFPKPRDIVDQGSFLSSWEAFESSLYSTFGQQKDFRQAFRRGEMQLETYKKKYGWSYSAPTTVVTNRPMKQTRDKAWLTYSWLIFDQYQSWREDHLNNNLDDVDLRYQSAMLSLIFESGQMSVEVIKAFHQYLIGGAKTEITRFSCYTYLPLTLENPSLNTNVVRDNEKLLEYQCYLSLHTLAQIDLWKRTSSKERGLPEDTADLYQRITTNFDNVNVLPKRLNVFCRCAVSWYEKYRNTSLSQALAECRIGRIATYSLPVENLRQLVKPKLSMPNSASFYEFRSHISLPPNTSTMRIANTAPNVTLSDFYRLVKEPFKKTSGYKVSGTQLTDSLTQLTNQYALMEWQQCFVQWLIHKLLSCTPSTVNSYRTTLIKDWMKMNEENVLDERMTSEELEYIYEQQIERHKSEKSKANFMARLKDLHRFAVTRLNLPALSSHFFHCDASQKHTKAGFVDESLFTALLKHIQMLSDISDIDRLALQSLCIVSYRCGLRMSELYKIQMRNISQCDEVWIEIRTNIFADNKTANSLRKIPVLPLLLDDEQAIFGAYLRHKRTMTKSTSAPFFTIGENTAKPFDKNSVSNYVGSFLKVTSGLEHLVFYHLRHSCLSRLQLMLELPKPNTVLPYCYPYETAQHDKVRSIIFKNSLLKGYWEIAAFAGHEDPSMTFGHYLHFSDLLAAPSREEYIREIEPKEAIESAIFTHHFYWKMHNKYQGKVFLAHGAKRLYKKLKLLDLSTTENNSVLNSSELLPNNGVTFSIQMCHQILEAIADGKQVDELAFKYRLTSETIQSWLANAKYIRSLVAAPSSDLEPQSRMFSRVRENALTPGNLKTQKEKDYVTKFNVKLRQYYPRNKEVFLKQMKYFLHHCTVSHSGVRFTHPDELTHFLKTFDFAIPRSHWRIVTSYLEGSYLKKEWVRAYKGLKVECGVKGKTTGRTGHGAVRLELIIPGEQSMIRETKMSKYSTHLLGYLLFYTYVMVGHGR